MKDDDLLRLAQYVRDHLSPQDAAFVAEIGFRETKRFATLLSAHGGESYTPAEFAALALRIAKRCAEPGGES